MGEWFCQHGVRVLLSCTAPYSAMYVRMYVVLQWTLHFKCVFACTYVYNPIVHWGYGSYLKCLVHLFSSHCVYRDWTMFLTMLLWDNSLQTLRTCLEHWELRTMWVDCTVCNTKCVLTYVCTYVQQDALLSTSHARNYVSTYIRTYVGVLYWPVCICCCRSLCPQWGSLLRVFPVWRSPSLLTVVGMLFQMLAEAVPVWPLTLRCSVDLCLGCDKMHTATGFNVPLHSSTCRSQSQPLFQWLSALKNSSMAQGQSVLLGIPLQSLYAAWY